jgi:hypothetical protein
VDNSTARKTGTLQFRQSIDCHNCGATNNIEEPWKKWIRNNPSLDSLQHGISINAVDALLRTKPLSEFRADGQLIPGHEHNTRKVFSLHAGRKVRIICHGLHVLRMSGATPGTSDWMTWDGRQITSRQLEQLFRYELDPDSLRVMEHREHKKISSQETLFGEEHLECV